MEKLLNATIKAWCWLRIVASLTLLGAGLGVGAYYLIGDVAGVVAGGSLVVIGLYFGVRTANVARRKDQLIQV